MVLEKRVKNGRGIMLIRNICTGNDVSNEVIEIILKDKYVKKDGNK